VEIEVGFHQWFAVQPGTAPGRNSAAVFPDVGGSTRRASGPDRGKRPGGEQGQRLAHDQAADDGDAQGAPQLRAAALLRMSGSAPKIADIVSSKWAGNKHAGS